MKRFDWVKGVGGWIIGAVGAGLATITYAQANMGLALDSVLLILVVLSVGGLAVSLSAVERDIEENIEGLQTDVNEGFDRVVTALEENLDGADVRTDGAGRANDGNDEAGEEIEPSGSGAFGGMVAGGAVGAAFGPPGVIIGGILGGLLGNEIEYQNLKEQEQEKLENAAWNTLLRNTGVSRNTAELVTARGPKESIDDVWKFEFEDEQGQRHLVILDPEDSRWDYRGVK